MEVDGVACTVDLRRIKLVGLRQLKNVELHHKFQLYHLQQQLRGTGGVPTIILLAAEMALRPNLRKTPNAIALVRSTLLCCGKKRSSYGSEGLLRREVAD